MRDYNYFALVIEHTLTGDIIGVTIYSPSDTPKVFKKGDCSNTSVSIGYRDDNDMSQHADVHWNTDEDKLRTKKTSIVKNRIKECKDYIKVLESYK